MTRRNDSIKPLMFVVLPDQECYDIIKCRFEPISKVGKYGWIKDMNKSSCLVTGISKPSKSCVLFDVADLRKPLFFEYFAIYYCLIKNAIFWVTSFFDRDRYTRSG